MPSSNELLSLIQSEDLEELESSFQSLNIFELAGLVKQEIKHSNFLGELLNPNSQMGHGDKVLKPFVRASLRNRQNQLDANSLTAIDFELTSTDDYEVRREYRNIDLLLLPLVEVREA